MARATAPGLRLTLLSARGAALYAGCGWWMALARAARAHAPDLVEADWLDCADAAGRAMAALRIGQSGLILDAATPGRAAIAAIAAAQGVRLLAARPPALDLAARHADRRLAEWLGNVTRSEP